MDKKNQSNYRMPEGFDPFATADAIRGLVDAIHHIVIEDEGLAGMSRAEKASLNSLVTLMQEHVHALHDYLTSIDDRTTLNLPMSEADFEAIHVKHSGEDEVKDPAAFYTVN